LQDLFSSKAAQRGEVIRRKKRDIERIVGLDLFMEEVAQRGYLAVENAGQVIVFCNCEPVIRLTAGKRHTEVTKRAPLSYKESGPETYQVSGHRSQRDAR